jgi:hypothetical protein
MKGFLLLLKQLGFEITPEQVAMLQQFALGLPQRFKAIENTVKSTLDNFDARLVAIEKRLDRLEATKDGTGNQQPS